MEIVYNDFIPFKGYVAMAFFGKIYARSEYNPLPRYIIKHEEIHAQQAKQLGGWWKFYKAYLKEWLKHLWTYKSFKKAYTSISFEKEAYAKQFI